MGLLNKQQIIDGFKAENLSLKEENRSLKESHRQEIEALNTSITTDRKNNEDAVKNLNELHKNTIEKLEMEKNTHILWLEEQIEEKNKEIKNQKIQLDIQETKKLATAYETQKKQYGEDVDKWSKAFFISIAILCWIAAFSVYQASWKPWYERFEYYVADLIFLSWIWFCGSQYSYHLKLRNDYANRQALAQTFHNIFTNLWEDADIKNKFIEKSTDILCAPSIINDKEPALSKEVLKQTIELAKLATNKWTSG
jgi:hypothetical protein